MINVKIYFISKLNINHEMIGKRKENFLLKKQKKRKNK